MKRFSIALTAVVIVFICTGNSRAEDPRAAFENFAARFKFFGFCEFLYGRTEIWGADADAVRAYLPILAEFESRHDTTADLLPLLKHENPKVRLLAIAAIYRSFDAQALPQIFAMRNDRGVTFPDPPPEKFDQRLADFGRRAPPLEPVTVGFAAWKVVRFYMGETDRFVGDFDSSAKGQADYFEYGARLDSDFEQYWQARKDLKYCASWYRVQSLRASRGTTPTQDYAVPALRQLRKRVDEIPMPDRRWVWLYLVQKDVGGLDALITQQEIKTMAVEVGHDLLLQLITGKTHFADPDLHAKALGWVVAKYAKQLLTETDAQTLHDEEESVRDGGVILAAELKPAMASKWLREEIGHARSCFERGFVAAELWRIAGPSESEYLANWYFAESNAERGAFPSARAEFLTEGSKTPNPEFRKLLARIIKDPRLEKTGPESTRQLVLIVNSWSRNPVASAEEIEEARGYPEIDHPQRKFPKLASWHARLKANVQEWEPRQP